MRRGKISRLVASLAAVVLAACVSGGRPSVGRGGQYVSPLGNFELDVPRYMFQTYIEEDFGESAGIVSFSGDMGSLLRIQSERIPLDAAPAFELDDTRDVAYREYLRLVIVPGLAGQFPQTTVLHEEFVQDELGRAYFGVVRVPEGSPLRDLKADRQLDSTLLMLIFHRGDYIYVIHVGTGQDLSEQRDPDAWTPDSVLEARGRITFHD